MALVRASPTVSRPAFAHRTRSNLRASTHAKATCSHDLSSAWRASEYNLSTRWPLAQKLFAHELARASLDARRVNLGWHQAKSYVGITYMYDDEETGASKADVFLSKYVVLDPSYENFVGCVRHELAHVLAGPTSVDHGRAFLEACEQLEVPEAWRGATTGAFYSRPVTQLMWAKCDAEEMLAKAKTGASFLPDLLYEKNVWDAPIGGNRTVFKDDETGTVLDAFEMYALTIAAEAEEACRGA
ncbi:unnamed product [Ostreococcus tauri]|uniref:Unnamed product n=1 Tax=Ostreococcus tauri TaxID=70448 RepID=Q01D51_OSTTA|nr:unnamed product [Ostreococcus tauri]OUS43710.1 hypothetical protein BE221DRAFT_83169 [Ostreococcus tauri]CAL52752.1 unnamed product [Ostreococcus tauri]|eukprot:XP_003078012.1 unnamed product [Ostreococcus tauri]